MLMVKSENINVMYVEQNLSKNIISGAIWNSFMAIMQLQP